MSKLGGVTLDYDKGKRMKNLKVNPESSQYSSAKLIENVLGKTFDWYYSTDTGALGCFIGKVPDEKILLLSKGLELMGNRVIRALGDDPYIGWCIKVYNDNFVYLEASEVKEWVIPYDSKD